MQPFYYYSDRASPCSDMQYITFIRNSYPYDFNCPCQAHHIRENEILETFPDIFDGMRGTSHVLKVERELTINQELIIEQELNIVKELIGIKQEENYDQEILIEVKQEDKDSQKADEQVENTGQEIYIDKDEFQEYKVYQDYKTGFCGLDEIEVVRT